MNIKKAMKVISDTEEFIMKTMRDVGLVTEKDEYSYDFDWYENSVKVVVKEWFGGTCDYIFEKSLNSEHLESEETIYEYFKSYKDKIDADKAEKERKIKENEEQYERANYEKLKAKFEINSQMEN